MEFDGHIQPGDNVNLAYFAPFADFQMDASGSYRIVTSMVFNSFSFANHTISSVDYDTSPENPLTGAIDPDISRLSLSHAGDTEASGVEIEFNRTSWRID